MSTERRIRASQQNGALSRGPKTAEGKRRSSRNAMRHGLLSNTVVLEDEDAVAFRKLLRALENEFLPQSRNESALVENLAVARWRLMRVWALEKEFLNLEIQKHDPDAYNPAERAALAFRSLSDNSRSLVNLNRYEALYDRQYNRALKLLLKSRENKKVPNEPTPISGQFPPQPPESPSERHKNAPEVLGSDIKKPADRDYVRLSFVPESIASQDRAHPETHSLPPDDTLVEHLPGITDFQLPPAVPDEREDLCSHPTLSGPPYSERGGDLMYPLKKGKTAAQAHVGLPEGTFEEEHGRKGFYGKSAHLYHAHPPTGWIRFEGKLRPHCFDLNKLTPSDLQDAEGMPLAFLGNSDIKLYVSRRSEPMPFYFRNADGDELIFVHRGNGRIETDFGPLDFRPGDYLVVPRAVTYRIVPESRDNFFLIVQSKTEFDQPDKGLIGQHALYDPAVIETPEPAPLLDDKNEWEVRIKVDDEISKIVYPFNPIDVVGWKGDLTVWKINIHDIRPIMSHRAHLPPSAHTSFVTGGAVVCSFVPRPLEQDEEALRVPFFHRNTDYDEFIFYHDGDFFSKDNIKPGMATLHPRGIHHGPHPKALANQKKKTHTDEYAVMLDGLNPIHVLPAGESVEWKDYWASWMEKKPTAPVESR